MIIYYIYLLFLNSQPHWVELELGQVMDIEGVIVVVMPNHLYEDVHNIIEIVLKLNNVNVY